MAKAGKDGTTADLKAEVKRLKAKLRKLRDKAGALAPATAKSAAKSAHPVSPLAPKGGFPALPAIGGVEFAAVAAGVKYANRTDVMLVRLAPGTTIAGAFTRSSTRSGCVRDCQTKLAAKVDARTGAAIIVNSGNSNAFTGKVGDVTVAAVTGAVADALAMIMPPTAP